MTVTFLMNAPDAASDCTPATTHNRDMDLASQTSTAFQESVASLMDELTHSFTTVATEPGVTDWPVASGGDPYQFSIDVTTAGGDLTFGALTLGGSAGRFHRVNSSCTSQEDWSQEEGGFIGTGTHVGSHTSINPASGADTDRYQILIACINANMHAGQNLSITTSADSFAEGPWEAADGPAFPDELYKTPEYEILRM